MAKTIVVYEHGRLHIGEQGFKESHWKAFVKLNEVHNGSYFDVLHNGLKFKQFVGVIQVDGLLVEIHPKADKQDEDRKWKGVLIEMLKRCGRLKADNAGNALLRRQNINLLEVYFDLFLTEINSLIHGGLIKKYRKETSNVNALKGKLEFAGHLRKNLIHKERFLTTHQVYDRDHLLHQVLRYGLEIVRDFSMGSSIHGKAVRILMDFPEVKRIIPNATILNSIQLNRKTAPYERALELAKFIIMNYSPDISGGRNNMIALLFDMNLLWEEYILKELKKHIHLNNLPFTVQGQSIKSFIEYRTIRPDIVLKTENETIVIDTKWKVPLYNQASIEDLRQMYTYARFWQAKKVVLLYPGSGKPENFVDFDNKDFDNQVHGCKVQTIGVLDEFGELNTEIGAMIINCII